MSGIKRWAQRIGWGKPTLKTSTLRKLSLTMPLLSVLIAAGIVRHEYQRRDHLASELLSTEREFDRLSKLAQQQSGGAAGTPAATKIAIGREGSFIRDARVGPRPRYDKSEGKYRQGEVH